MDYKSCFDYIHKHKRIFIYGTGPTALNLHKLLEYHRIKWNGFIVSDEFKSKIDTELPRKVISLSEYNAQKADGIIIAVSQQYHNKITTSLKEIGYFDCYILGNRANYNKWMTERPNTSVKIGICPYCKGKTKIIYRGKDYNRYYSDDIIRDLNETFYLYRCQNCDLQYIGNAPNHLGIYYPDTYYGNVSYEDMKKAAEYDKVQFVTKYKKRGNLLEIGPSMGAFCLAAKEKGFDVSAIEMNEQCVEFLNNTLNIKAILSDKPELVLYEKKHKYDIICLWHSLEHMQKPWEVLDACIHSLNKNGIIVIGVPNPNAFLIRIMHRFWPHFDFPRHLFGISPKWLKLFCNINHIKMVNCISNTKVNNQWNSFAWGKFFEFLFSGKSQAYEIGVKFRLFEKLEEKNGFGSTYVVVLRK